MGEMIDEFLDRVTIMKDIVHYDKRCSFSLFHTYKNCHYSRDKVTNFIFTLGNGNATDWTRRVQYINEWRAIADRCVIMFISSIIRLSFRYTSHFNVSVWSPMGLQCDAIMNLRPIAQVRFLCSSYQS